MTGIAAARIIETLIKITSGLEGRQDRINRKGSYERNAVVRQEKKYIYTGKRSPEIYLRAAYLKR